MRNQHSSNLSLVERVERLEKKVVGENLKRKILIVGRTMDDAEKVADYLEENGFEHEWSSKYTGYIVITDESKKDILDWFYENFITASVRYL